MYTFPPLYLILYVTMVYEFYLNLKLLESQIFPRKKFPTRTNVLLGQYGHFSCIFDSTE